MLRRKEAVWFPDVIFDEGPGLHGPNERSNERGRVDAGNQAGKEENASVKEASLFHRSYLPTI